MQHCRVISCLVFLLIALGCRGRADLLYRFPTDAVGVPPIHVTEPARGVFARVGDQTVALVEFDSRPWFTVENSYRKVILVLREGEKEGSDRGSAFVFSFSFLSWRATMRTLELRSQRCSSGAIRIDGEFLGDGVDLIPWRGTYNEKILDVRLILRRMRLRPAPLSEIIASITGGGVYPAALDCLDKEFPPWGSVMAVEGGIVPSQKPGRDGKGE